MVAEASIVGVLRVLLIVIGAIVVLRFLAQLANAKRNMAEEKKMEEEKRAFNKERERTAKNVGKTRIINKTPGSADVEDVDFEELD